ncbi:hypothetical protein [Allostreptomyces psammosilenae]|uniref:Glycosyltransferase n=1 Tax=Allostreptomyces psammosilenae TaxID=1892865 RepID=A0A853A1N6_9ACTN|nr:hypothetical protein [Allostreptomyces psammosilenae]NYI08476.1 hypothetical protein [Allostreptomyces psammosilenae]
MRVLCLAFGTYRTRAVRVYTDRLLERGARVHLVVTDPADWAEAELDPAVRVHGLAPLLARHRAAAQWLPARFADRAYRRAEPLLLWRAARRRVLGAVDFDALDLLLLGDAHAAPLAWEVRRRRPDLPIAVHVPAAAATPADRRPQGELRA